MRREVLKHGFALRENDRGSPHVLDPKVLGGRSHWFKGQLLRQEAEIIQLEDEELRFFRLCF